MAFIELGNKLIKIDQIMSATKTATEHLASITLCLHGTGDENIYYSIPNKEDPIRYTPDTLRMEADWDKLLKAVS